MVTAHFALARLAEGLCPTRAEDMRNCNLAIAEYKRVLQIDALHLEASKNLAWLLWNVGDDESETYYRKGLALHPNDPEILAAIGAIDGNRSRPDVMRTVAAIPQGKRLLDFPVCSEVRRSNLDRVNEGISLLTKASNGNSEDFGIMGWLGELYSIRAELQCGDPKSYAADTREAEKWYRLEHAGLRREGYSRGGSRYPPAPPPPPEK